MSRSFVLLILIAAGLSAAGWIYGFYWKRLASQGQPIEASGILQQLDEVVQVNEALEREIASLRSLVQGGGDVAVPQDLIAFVEKNIGWSFVSTPKVQRANEQEIADAVWDELHQLHGGRAGLAAIEKQWAMIGLISAEQKIWPQVVQLRSQDARGILASEKALVAMDFDVESISDVSILVQLLTEMLMRQKQPVLKEKTNFESVIAREGVVRGVVDHVVSKFRILQARRLGAIDGVGEEVETEDMGFAPWAEDLVRLPYEWGIGYVGQALSRGDNIEQIAQNISLSTTAKGEWQLGRSAIKTLLEQTSQEQNSFKILQEIIGDKIIHKSDEEIVWQVFCASKEIAEAVRTAFSELMKSRYPDDLSIPQEFRRYWIVLAGETEVLLCSAKNQKNLDDLVKRF